MLKSTGLTNVSRNHEQISRQRARSQGIPLICAAAFLSLVASVSLFVSGEREQGIFIGIWVPSILSLGNLLVQRSNHE